MFPEDIKIVQIMHVTSCVYDVLAEVLCEIWETVETLQTNLLNTHSKSDVGKASRENDFCLFW